MWRAGPLPDDRVPRPGRPVTGSNIPRPRDPRKTVLWGLLDTLYERVKGSWEERFERRYGFWRGLADEAVARCLDCEVWDNGFARVRCRKCPQEFLVAFSCKGRGLCPSCGAKRAAELAAFLMDEVVEDVGHTQWVFTVPKMLQVYFLHHRELLGKSSRTRASPVKDERVDAEEFVAHVLVQIPDPRRHLVRYYGGYSNRARGQRRKAEKLQGSGSGEVEDAIPAPPERAALRRRWASLIRRVYEVDPLVCPRCGAEMRIIAFITETIRRILDHIRKRGTASRSSPHPQPAVAHIA
jgi:hypothetical protein